MCGSLRERAHGALMTYLDRDDFLVELETTDSVS